MEKKLFPDYLVFGKLNEQSIANNGDFQIAHYELFDEKVIELRIRSDGRTELREFDNGHELAYSTYPDIKKCVLFHYDANRIATHPTMHKIICHVSQNRLAYYSLDSTNELKIPQATFLPAGAIHTIRVPIINDNKEAFEAYINNNTSFLRLTNHYVTSLFVIDKNWFRRGKNFFVEIAEFTAPLAFIPEGVDELITHNVISNSHECLRAVIHDCGTTAINFEQRFKGEKYDEFISYIIQYKKADKNFPKYFNNK